MNDAKLKRAFREAAEIAEGMPESLREAAFNRALDEILGEQGGAAHLRGSGAGAAEDEAEETAAHEAQRGIRGIPGMSFVLEKSVAALNLAGSHLGLEEMSAEQVADTLEERFGVHVNEGVVARALESADSVVTTVRRGGETLYRVIHPEETAGPEAPRPTARSKVKPGSQQGAGARGKAKAQAKSKPQTKPKSTSQSAASGSKSAGKTKGKAKGGAKGQSKKKSTRSS
ncbi:MAG: hypothetical protein ACLFTT_14260 [Candidatus Hydrogenedentota bacterium]